MSEKLDKELTDRIKEVFDNYEDTSADEGWLLLRERFPEEEKKRRGLIWLWWSAAAILLIGLGIGLWVSKQPLPQQNIAKTSHPIKTTEGSLKTQDTVSAHQTVSGSSKSNSAATEQMAATPAATNKNQRKQNAIDERITKGNGQQLANTKATRQALTIRQSTGQRHAESPSGIKQQAALDNNNPGSPNNHEVLANNGEKANNKATAIIKENSNKAGSEPTVSNDESVDKNQVENKALPASAPVLAKVPDTNPDHAESSKQMERLLAQDKANKNTKEVKKQEETSKPTKKVIFGLYASTYYSTAKGSNNQLNAGGGISSDIKLSNRIRLSTGIAVGQNTLAYNNGAQPPSSGGTLLASADPTFKPVTLTFASSRPVVLKNYNASLIGLDIPFNLKFQLTAKKTDPFIAAGFSSGTFINETYTTSYTYTNEFYNLSGAQPKDDVIHKNFGTFNVIKTLNLSFGMGTQVGKSNRLVIEPFVRYPMLGLGAENIQFTSTGVNLRFVFEGKK